jgi:hypothetical protein
VALSQRGRPTPRDRLSHQRQRRRRAGVRLAQRHTPEHKRMVQRPTRRSASPTPAADTPSRSRFAGTATGRLTTQRSSTGTIRHAGVPLNLLQCRPQPCGQSRCNEKGQDASMLRPRPASPVELATGSGCASPWSSSPSPTVGQGRGRRPGRRRPCRTDTCGDWGCLIMQWTGTGLRRGSGRPGRAGRSREPATPAGRLIGTRGDGLTQET